MAILGQLEVGRTFTTTLVCDLGVADPPGKALWRPLQRGRPVGREPFKKDRPTRCIEEVQESVGR